MQSALYIFMEFMIFSAWKKNEEKERKKERCQWSKSYSSVSCRNSFPNQIVFELVRRREENRVWYLERRRKYFHFNRMAFIKADYYIGRRTWIQNTHCLLHNLCGMEQPFALRCSFGKFLFEMLKSVLIWEKNSKQAIAGLCSARCYSKISTCAS